MKNIIRFYFNCKSKVKQESYFPRCQSGTKCQPGVKCSPGASLVPSASQVSSASQVPVWYHVPARCQVLAICQVPADARCQPCDSQVPVRCVSTTTVCGVNYQLLAAMLLKYPSGKFIVAVDPSLRRTMASETVYLIDSPLSPPFIIHYPLGATCTVRATNQ